MRSSRPFSFFQCRLLTTARLARRPSILPLTASSSSSSLRQIRAPRTALYHTTQNLGNNQPQTSSPQAIVPRPTHAPKPVVDIKHIRQNPELYSKNALERNYPAAAAYPQRINELFAEWQTAQREARGLRERGNALRRLLTGPGSTSRDDPDNTVPPPTTREELLAEARQIKASLSTIEATESRLTAEMEDMALAIPNLTSEHTPRGDEPRVLSYINDHPETRPSASDRVWRSHIHVGAELGILDFAAGGTTSGWGWYYLLDEAAQLEQALVAYALKVASTAEWRQVSPPSIVYGHIAGACGFQPRDANGETQIYNLAGQADKAELVLAGTAEIPLAGMKAETTLDETELPSKRVAVSRCYRAEAGARGLDTKGLYRVHEFTKVELFAWTAPDVELTEEIFNEILALQTKILESLGLHCRVLEMPANDLGASATRKRDIEAFFPSRRERNDGWGEVTSASVCTDYQTRRLATRVRAGGKLAYPWTVNGTAMAVPRVLAAILENGWDETTKTVRIPKVLQPYMGQKETIGPPAHWPLVKPRKSSQSTPDQ
ncbi:hypothetical protein B0H63DRAFT_469995 [Podospora didyma]|uniref:serine--tRNA ligase n=1 Tax=Podospora didyma TaxID=330526 RepID=A0AAE0U1I6_9PEZI|nr:hypothetical protein B0H63DRAFT_469995 [Podospora didyma]